jgi:hypothetical protein
MENNMHVANLGVESFDSILKNIGILKSNAGELIISMMKTHPNGGGVFLILPIQIKDHEGEMYLSQWMPFFKERVFFMKFSDIQFIKLDPLDHVKDNYLEFINTVNKHDVEDLLSSLQEHVEEVKEVEQINLLNSLPVDSSITLH